MEGAEAEIPYDIFNSTDVDELPSYSPASTRRRDVYRAEHTCILENNKHVPWLTLKFRSRATDPDALPIFTNGDVISGTVTVNLSKAESWKNVKIALAGFMTLEYQPFTCFMEIPCSLWPTSSETKVDPQVSWPFSLKVPDDCASSVTPKDPPKLYKLPPTVRVLNARIEYSLSVIVKKGALSKSEVGSTIVFIPRTIAPPPSTMRFLTNAERMPLVGPKADPVGWHVLPAVTARGTIFKNREVDIQYTLPLASPLMYVMGYPIPLHMSIKCADPQALQLIAAPTAISVKLIRLSAYGPESLKDLAPVRGQRANARAVANAIFWHNTNEAPAVDDEGTVHLHGEIMVPSNIKPSFVFPKFTFTHFVELYPFSAPGFSSATPQDQGLIHQKITMVTQNAPGFVPRSQAPPTYRRRSH